MQQQDRLSCSGNRCNHVSNSSSSIRKVSMLNTRVRYLSSRSRNRSSEQRAMALTLRTV